MKVLILWTQWSGYMDACAKELQALLQCDLDIVCLPITHPDLPFCEDAFFKFPCRRHVMSAETRGYVDRQSYALVLVCSWHIGEFRQIARNCRGRSIRLLCMDNQWTASLRQYGGLLAFRAKLRGLYDFAFVPGGRQACFASYLGFAADEIIEGHLSCSEAFAGPAHEVRSRSFLFVGRLAPEKGIETLARAWRLYARDRKNPWTLKICGEGPRLSAFDGATHVDRLGFVQPLELPAVMADASVLVLPSLREPWGIVVHEAATAGMGLVLTTACGAGDYFLRDRLNGRLAPPGDPAALNEALQWFDALDDCSLKQAQEKSARLGAQRSPRSWACAASRALASRPRPDRGVERASRSLQDL